jgi:hypothetical protein
MSGLATEQLIGFTVIQAIRTQITAAAKLVIVDYAHIQPHIWCLKMFIYQPLLHNRLVLLVFSKH